MHMLLERAARFFQAQGYAVRVAPCAIGASGAIHTADLALAKPGERERAVFVFEELAGPAPLEARALVAKDLGAEPVFVVGAPSPEVEAWARRHRHTLLVEEELVDEPPGPATPAPEAAPAETSGDGGAELLPSGPRAPAEAAEPVAPAPAPEPQPSAQEARAGNGDGGAELLPPKPGAAQADERLATHDLTLWDPRERLGVVKRAAKARSFDSTGVAEAPESPWLRGLRERCAVPGEKA